MLAVASGAAYADGAAILRCRLQVDPAQRFACYEAIAVPTPSASAPQQPVVGTTRSAETFGLEQKAAQAATQSIESRVAGAFYGWEPNERITLTNGQIWQVTDDSKGALNARDPKVTIRRGALGAFYMEIEGTNRSPRVRRIK
jgi:phage baseplate assembly protein W